MYFVAPFLMFIKLSFLLMQLEEGEDFFETWRDFAAGEKGLLHM